MTTGAVLIAGPDGAGKSTVGDAISKLAASRGVRIGRAHHRPGLVFGGGEGRQVTDPHAKPPRSLPLSLVKLAMVFADHLVGGRSRWEPQRAAGVLVVERGWADMAVDPRRYRLASRALPAVRAAARVLPQPDLVAVLVGDPIELHRRKPEIGVAEVTRQLGAWRDVASWAGRRALEVDTVVTAPDIVAEQILDALTEPVRLGGGWRRVRLTPGRIDMRAIGRARPALAVYQPQSRRARLGVLVARRWPGRCGSVAGEPTAGLHDLWEQLGLRVDGAISMTSSTAGRHILATCLDGRMDAVVKIGGSDDQRLRHEAAMLAAPLSPVAGVRRPEVIWAGEWRSRFVLVTRAVLRSRNDSWSVDEVASVIDSLHRAGPDGTPITHGDLAPWNLVRTGAGPVLLDWESARWADEPLHDLAHFVVSEGALLGRHTPATALALLCAPESPGARLVHRRGYSLADSRSLLVDYLTASPSSDPRTVRFTSEMLRLVNS